MEARFPGEILPPNPTNPPKYKIKTKKEKEKKKESSDIYIPTPN